MACRHLVELPKIVFRRSYFQSSVASSLSFNSAWRAQAPFEIVQCRCASTTSTSEVPEPPEIKDNIFRKIRRRLGLTEYAKPYYRAMSVHIYENLDTIDISEIFREFQLEDTFYSWYLVMELHFWMILSRASQHGKEGRVIKQCLGNIMWDDVRRRMKLVVSDLPSSEQTKTMNGLSSEMDYALVLYDEAALSGDKRLAEAVWIRLYRAQSVDPILLEKCVCYVRKQIRHLDLIPKDDWLLRRKLTWLPLNQCKI